MDALFKNDRPKTVIDETNTVTKFFPREVKLTLPDYSTRFFNAGVQLVPAELSEHPWLKDNGMVDVPQGSPLPPAMLSAPPGSAAFAKSGVYDATRIPDPRVTDAGLQAARVVADMAAQNVRVAEDVLAQAQAVSVGAAQAVADITARLQTQSNDAPRGESMASAAGVGGNVLSPPSSEDEDKKIVASLSNKEKADFNKLSDEDKELFLASRRSPK